jgi:phosphomannomutase
VSGDELGLLLADVWLEALGLERPLVVATLVSSPALDALAQRHSAELRRTLTGFKWICRAANEDHFAFAYEEALGYCLAKGAFRPVLDKDGLAAFALVCGAARRQARLLGLSPGRALRERLKQIAVRDGLWVASPKQARALDDASRTRVFRAPDRLRRHLPAMIRGFSLTECKDYLGEAATDEFAGRQDLLSLFLERGDGVQARLHVRPSGTEAKLKLYVHVGAKLSSVDEYATQYDELSAVADDLGAALMSELELTS